MDKPTQNTSALPRSLLFAALAAFALVAAIPPWNSAQAQSAAVAPMDRDSAMRLHADGLAMEKHHNDQGAYAAFLAAAEGGYAPSQRRLGEIYDHGNAAVPRDYEQSIRWYQMASDGGEDIPWLRSHMADRNYGF